jgi:translation initiation factor IF-1
MAGDAIELEGVVREQSRGGYYLVDVQAGALRREVLARLSGRLTTRHIRVLPGDVVTVEVSPYDLTRGRITFRGRKQERTT